MTVARRSASSGNSRSSLNLVAQKTAKKKARKSSKRAAEQGVLGSLRSTRPTRIGGERRRAGAAARQLASSPEVSRAQAEIAKPAAGTTAEAKPAKAAKPAAAKATKAKTTKAKAAKTTKAEAAKPKSGKSAVKPTKPVVPGPRPTGPREPDGRPSGGEIVTTAVQAAGELAQIGATVGAQFLRRAARRIPRP